MDDLHKWTRIRKDLYIQMERQVRARLGEDSPELLRYRRRYEAEFGRKWKASTQSELWARISQARVLLLGDFHALHQSQKAQVRILRGLSSSQQKVLAVEFLEAVDQEVIQKFMKGKISEKSFLKAISWEERWGFPWEHYRPLLLWAQKNQVEVVGINRTFKKKTATTLKSRDVFAGKKIAELVRANPQALICVVYGDLHLAKEHIPAELINILGKGFSSQIVRLFQNSEKIYFQLLRSKQESGTDLIQIGKTDFCLMSVPPWVKWQNYLMYLEQAFDLGLGNEDEEDADHEDGLDFSDHVGRYVGLIADELNCAVSTDGLSVYSAQDSSFWNQVKTVYDLKKQSWIEKLIAEEISFYLPEAQIAYLARATVNHAASLAMQYIHAHLNSKAALLTNVPSDFSALIWCEGVAYFGSKIVNYKRKTDTLVDIKGSLVAKGAEGLGKEALQLALAQKMHELLVLTGSSQHRMKARPTRKWSYFIAAKLLGGIIGERLYAGYSQKVVGPKTIVEMLRKPVATDDFKSIYYDFLEVIESLPVSFLSKKEKL